MTQSCKPKVLLQTVCCPDRADYRCANRAGNIIRIGQFNIGAAVIAEIEIILAQWTVDPVRYSDQRRALDIATHARVHARDNDWPVGQAHNSGSCPAAACATKADVSKHSVRSARSNRFSIDSTPFS